MAQLPFSVSESGVRCPKCEGSSQVIDTRIAPQNQTRRRRKCVECDERFTTYERTVGSDPTEELLRLREVIRSIKAVVADFNSPD